MTLDERFGNRCWRASSLIVKTKSMDAASKPTCRYATSFVFIHRECSPDDNGFSHQEKRFLGKKRNGGYIDQQPQWRKITMIGRLKALSVTSGTNSTLRFSFPKYCRRPRSQKRKRNEDACWFLCWPNQENPRASLDLNRNPNLEFIFQRWTEIKGLGFPFIGFPKRIVQRNPIKEQRTKPSDTFG